MKTTALSIFAKFYLGFWCEGCASAAALRRTEVEFCISTRHVVFIHDDHASRAHERAEFEQMFVGNRGIEMLLRNHAARRGRPFAHRKDLLSRCDTAADVFDNHAQRACPWVSRQTGIADLSGKGEQPWCPWTCRCLWTQRSLPRSEVCYETLANVSTLLITVGFPNRPTSDGLRRTWTRCARLPSTEAISAVSSPHTICAGSQPHFQIQAKRSAQNIFSQKPRCRRRHRAPSAPV